MPWEWLIFGLAGLVALSLLVVYAAERGRIWFDYLYDRRFFRLQQLSRRRGFEVKRTTGQPPVQEEEMNDLPHRRID